MKRKHKIVIATGVISLSMITAMATGLINTGNLFAEDPTTLSTTVFNGFQAGDKVILGGKEFTALDTNGKLLAKDNAGEKTKYSNDLINAQLSTWNVDINKTYDANLIVSDSTNIPSYDDLGGGTLVSNIGNGTEFWTSTSGSNDNTQIAINGQGMGKATTSTVGGSVTSTFTCSGGGGVSDYFITGNEDGDTENPTKCRLVEIRTQDTFYGANHTIVPATPGGLYHKFDNPNSNQTVTLDKCVSLYASLDGTKSPQEIMDTVGGSWGDTILSKGYGSFEAGYQGTAFYWDREDSAIAWGGYKLNLETAGDECVRPQQANKAAVRPMITADFTSVMFVSENGTPVDADPQNSAVSLTLLDNDIKFALAADQLTAVEAANSDTIKVKYDAGNITTGSNQNIKVIVLGKDDSGNDKIIRYETLENLTSTPSGEVSIDLSSKGLNLPAGKYTLQLFNEQDNSAETGKSNHASAMQEISLDLSQGLEASDVVASGDKVPTSADFYDEKGVTYSISGSANQAILNEYDYIRIGTLAELDGASPTAYQNNKASYTKDGVYEKVQEVDDSGNPKVDDAGDPVYNYDNCLYVQLANGSNTADPNFKTTTMLRLDSVKIDSKEPYFPSVKNGEGKPIEIVNIKDDTPSTTSFFSAVFGLDQPDDDLEEEFGGGHIKLIPHAMDFAASDYNADGSLKNDAKALDGGIASYKLEAKVLDVATGLVDDTKPVVSMTIDTNDKKFTDVPEDPYFELNGEEAYWVKLTAVDRAGREKTIERKLYMDESVAAEPKVEIHAITKQEDGTEIKEPYAGGLIKDENDQEVANWVGKDLQIDLSLTTAELAEVKSGIDHYEYAAKGDIEQWLKDNPGSKREDYDGWISLGKKKDASGKDTKDPETMFKTDTLVNMNDTYYFRAVSRAGIGGKEATFHIKMDKQEPKLRVVAEVYDSENKKYIPYKEGYKAEQGIRFTITSEGDIPVSGVKYYYRGVPKGWTSKNPTTKDGDVQLPTDKEIPWIEIKKNDDKKYQMLLTDQFDGTYYFRAETGAQVTTAEANVKTLPAVVGVTQPKTPISVEVIDADGDAYDGKWTNKNLTITLTGGLDGTDQVKYYEYATDRTATAWTKIQKDASETYKLEIDSDQLVNQNYYFRVIKDDPTDPTLEIPYSTTQKAIKIRHDAQAPMFKADPDGVKLDPAPPAIATTFVTLSVEMTETDFVNSSPIASYSVDGGTTWIAADGKNSRKFTYDFKDNTSDIEIQVKDEAGNLSTYPTKLTVDNIDKTGPSAPSFPEGFVNGEWKKDPQSIAITFEPADTGAQEKIRYRIQKYDGTDFKDYDVTQDTFHDAETWLEGNWQEPTVTVSLTDNGEYRIIAETIDTMGRKSATSKTTGVIRIDQEAPEVSGLEEVEDKWATAATGFLNALTGDTYFKDHITYRFTGTDTGGSGLDKFQYQLADEQTTDPDPDGWIDTYKGEVNIEKDFVGKLYVRALDYAGNISDVVYTSDLIRVDATEPTLSVSPESLDGQYYTDTDSVTITAKDDGSGIKGGEVCYKSSYSGTENFPNDCLALSLDGTAVLNNLPNGAYDITFEAEDNSDHQVSLNYAVKIDKDVPEIKIIDNAKSGIVKEKEIRIEVRDTISGRNDLTVTLDGKDVELTLTDEKGTELTEGTVSVYTAKITANGTLEAEVTSNSKHKGNFASAREEINITNVYNVNPKIKLDAFIGKSEDKDRYTEGEWTSEHIEIVLSNTENAIKDNELTFQYQEYDADGKPLTNGWTNTDDGDPDSTNKNGKFSVYKNGVRTYEFRAVVLDPDDPTKDPILYSNTIRFQVMQDTGQPAAPKLVVPTPEDYTQQKWYNSYQTLEVEFTADTAGAGQWIEYWDEADAKPQWKKVTTPNANGKYEIRVSGDKEHKIYIRSNDYFNRFSTATNAVYVNIDTATPTFDVDVKYSSINASVNILTEDKGSSTIGISGVEDIVIQKKDENGDLIAGTDQHIYGQRITLNKDKYGNGTYQITLKTNSGKTVEKDIVIDGISLPKPVISVTGSHYAADGVSAGTPYTSGTWTRDKKIRLEVSVMNTADAGSNLTYEYQEDGDNTWTRFSSDGKSNILEVSGAGKHAINIRAVNASDTASETYHFNVWIADDFDSSFVIQEETKYVADSWYNETQTVEAMLAKNATGCKEWIEYSEDKGATWKHNSRNEHEVSATGAHVIKVRKNDELGSGNANAGKTIHVNIDKEPIRDFKVQIDKNSYSSFLSTITFGLYHKEEKQAEISGDFGLSEQAEIWYQIVDDPADYVNQIAATSTDAGWQPYTKAVDLKNDFKGFVYAKAKDRAGNTSNIIRTDGIVIDTVGPTIELQYTDGDWLTTNSVNVSVSDFADVTGKVVGNASGITMIEYETKETKPIEGSVEVNNDTATISGLHDGEYTLHITGSDKAGNTTEVKQTIKVDSVKPALKIEGYQELSFASSNDLILKPIVGASGVRSLQLHAELYDGTQIDETLSGPDYKYQATKNGTYTFTLTNDAGVSVIEKLEVNNITSSMDDIMGLDIKTKDLNGDEIDYLHAETLPGAEATPQWTANDVVFRAHGGTKFKASIDDGLYTDFKADGTFTVSEEGIHTVRIRNYENDTVRTFVVKIDKYPVDGVRIMDPQDGTYDKDNWFNKKQVVHATFTRNDRTGIREWLEYYDPSTASWEKGDSVILDHEGTHTVRFRGNDELNRPTAEQTAIVNIDMTAPTDMKINIEKSKGKEFINYFFPNTYDETVEVTIHVNGDISGNRKIQYQLVNEEAGESYTPLFGWQTYENPFTISDGFKGKIYARAIDNAGNQTINTVTEDGIIVDTNTPEILFQTSPMTEWGSENEVKATITPTLSGLQRAWYTITKNGIVTKYDIELKEIDASNNILLKDLPNGNYVIDLYAKNKAGKTGEATLDSVMFENRAPILKVDAQLEKKASSIPVSVDVDMSNLYTTLESLTWQTNGTTPQDILADKKFTIHNNGVYKIVATTSSGVQAEKTLVVTNITNVSSVIGIKAYFSEDPTKEYTGGTKWSAKDITLEVRDTTGKVPVDELMMEMRITDVKSGKVISEWTAMEADKNDAELYKTVAADEGSYLYEFRGTYEGVSGSTAAIQVNIDRSEPKKPLYTEDTLKKYDNDAWHSEYAAELNAEIDATEGCDEWLEYNIDGATDYNGDLLWTPTRNQTADTIKVVDDKDHIVQIRTTDRLGRHSQVNELHVKLDSTRPTNFYIKEGENLYQDFLDKLTGGNFYQKSRTVEIGGDFKISGIDKIEYQIVEKETDFDAAGTWKKLNVAEGAESGTITLLPGTKGLIYARGVDKAGNETGIIRTDLITIDNSAPLLIVPDDATDWTDVTTMKIKVKDEQSGIRSVTYHSDDPEQSGEVILSDTVDADGYREGTIMNLKDGQYLLDVVATNGAGETQTKKPRVMIDTVTPKLEVEGQTSKPQTSVTLDLIPVVGGSGMDEIQQLEMKDDGSFEIIKRIPYVEGQTKYPYEFIENGTYYFHVVNGAGIASDPVTEIVISNIKSERPVIVFRTDNGYDPTTWSGKPVTLEVNTNTNAELSYRKKGDTTYIDADHIYYQDLKFDKTGTYTYEFRAVFKGVGGAADIETVEEYTVKVDLEAPKKPSIENLSDYDQWFKLDKTDPSDPRGKIVTLIRDTSDYVNGAHITKYGDGSKETAYYHIDGEVDVDGNPVWIEMDGDSVEIKKVGDNIVTFKIIDEVKGHETLSDPLHVKIYEENPTITLHRTTKPVKSMKLGIEIGGAISKDDQVKKLTVERVGSDIEEIEPEQGGLKYDYPISKNGTYIIRVEMEFGGVAEQILDVTNIIEEEPILDVSATYDDAGTAKDYEFGKWSTSEVQLKAVEAKADPNLTIQVRSKVKGGAYGNWEDYTSGDAIVIDTTGTYIYQFKTKLAQGADVYETVMDETFAVKVDLEEPDDVIINEYDIYNDPDKWVSDSVNITTTFKPDTRGADEWVEYTMDNGKTWVKKNSVMITDEGEHTITFRSADETGRTHSATEDTVYVNIDRTSAGTVSMKVGNDAAITGRPNNITFDHFYKSSDTVVLEFKDNKGNLITDGTIYYQFADGRNGMADEASAWQTYDAANPFTLKADFKGSIYAYAVNKSGKATEVIRSNGITVDDKAPEIKKPVSDMNDWNRTGKLQVEIRDDVSGVDPDTVKYQLYDTSGANPVGSPTAIHLIDGKGSIDLSDGEYYVEILASDKAGNAATPRKVKVMIDAAVINFNASASLAAGKEFSTITATINTTPLSGIQGIYIRGNGSSWQLIDTNSPASYKVYKNGTYEVKVVNGAGKDSDIQKVTVSGIVNDLPDYTIKTTDGFEFGDYWYKDLTIWVEAPDADEIYYSTNGKDGPWKIYKDKIEINETSAYQFTFKLVKDGNELITLPYDTRVIKKQADGAGTPSIISERNVRTFVRSVFTAFREETQTKWYNTGSQVKFPLSTSTAPGMKAGTYVQILEADENGNGIGYDENNFTLVDDDDPYYTFNQEGHYVVYQYYAYYIEGEEDRPSKPTDITKTYYNIDGTPPESLVLRAEVDGSDTILNNLTGGLFFKEPVEIIPQGSDSLSGIDHYEFQKMTCSGDECESITPKDNNWQTAETLLIPQDFEGFVYVRAYDAAEPANYLERSIRLSVKDDTTTYKILEDISDWTNTQNLNIEVTPSTAGLQELHYKVYGEGQEEEASRINVPAVDTENKHFTIHDIPEGVYNLKVIPVENGGTSINRGAHAMKVDRTDPIVKVEMEQSNESATAKLMNRLTLQHFYKPGLIVRATASDQAGELKIDPQHLTIEYSLNGADWKEYTTPLRFDKEEIVNVSFRAIDQAGNISDIVGQDGIAIDASAPTFEGASNNVTYWLPRTVRVKDELSGVDSVKLNGKAVGTTVLVKETGTSRIEAVDRSGNESAIALTIKGLDGIKDEDINDELIAEIEKEFEEQKPGYDQELADKTQKEIDDLKNRLPKPGNPGDDEQGGSDQNPGNNDGNSNDGANGDGNGNGSDGNGAGSDGKGSGNGDGNNQNSSGNNAGNGANGSGSGTNGSGNNNSGGNTGTIGTGQGTNVMSGTTKAPLSNNSVKTGDGSSAVALFLLGMLSLLLAGAVKLKQRFNELQNR